VIKCDAIGSEILRDHAPHYHAIYGEFKAPIAIRDDRVLAGRLPARARRLVITWAGAHRAELMANWERARNGQDIISVGPLE
jgi:Domain of unknown function (DUF4160)